VSFKTTWGTPATITEITSGHSDIALLGPEAAAYTADAGPDRRLVNFAQLTNRDGSFIVAKTPMASFRVTNLAGKTLVTGSAAGTPTLVLVHLLKKAGLDPRKEVTIRTIASFADVLPAFLNDPNAHFAQAFEPAVTKAVMEGRVHRVASVGELLGPVPYTAFVATAGYMKKHPRVLQGFTNAIYKAQLWTEAASADEVVTTIEPYFKGVERPVMQTVVEQYKKLHTWAPNPRLSREGLDLMLDLIVQAGVVKRKPAIDEVVDFSFGETAVKSVTR
jgi:NitT/TauT family transport system substrate-binding protein